VPPVEETVYPVMGVPAVATSEEDEIVNAGSAKHDAEVATGTTPFGYE